jgi:hypothetical protein
MSVAKLIDACLRDKEFELRISLLIGHMRLIDYLLFYAPLKNISLKGCKISAYAWQSGASFTKLSYN